jgi:hypothetical protein
VFVLDTNGNLRLDGQLNGQWGTLPPPPSLPVDGHVAAFQLLNAFQVYVLGTDGNLWFTPAPFGTVPNPKRQQVDGHVAL